MATRNQLEAGATALRTPESKACVSEWVIPGGCNYDLAYSVQGFFNSLEAAEAYAKEWDSPPEMATAHEITSTPLVITKKLYDDFVDNTSSRNRAKYFQGFFSQEIRAQGFDVKLIKSLCDGSYEHRDSNYDFFIQQHVILT